MIAATPTPITDSKPAMTKNNSRLSSIVTVAVEQLVHAVPAVPLASVPTPVINTVPNRIAAIARNIGIRIIELNSKRQPPPLRHGR